MTAQEYIIRSKKLFEEWKEKQRQEPDEKYNEYKFGNVDKTSFLPDGIIDPDKYFSADKKVLFIAKEANWGGSDNENEISSQEDEFWLRIVVNKEQDKDGNIIYNESKFSKGLAMLYNAYINNSFDTPDYSHEGLKNVAFINLNKRGGYSYCSYSTLKGYAQEYGKLIAQQIDLINPDIIICCGTNLVGILNDYVTPKTCKAKIIGVYHPSYYCVSKEQHLKLFECVLTNKPIEKIVESNTPPSPKPKRGIIFDTNQSYNDAAVEEMLGATQPCVTAFGKAAEKINNLNIGDVIFYYHIIHFISAHVLAMVSGNTAQSVRFPFLGVAVVKLKRRFILCIPDQPGILGSCNLNVITVAAIKIVMLAVCFSELRIVSFLKRKAVLAERISVFQSFFEIMLLSEFLFA